MSNEVIELKQQGNKLFSQRNYEEAISCYTKALVSVLYLTSTSPMNRYLKHLYCTYFQGV